MKKIEIDDAEMKQFTKDLQNKIKEINENIKPNKIKLNSITCFENVVRFGIQEVEE